MTEKKIDKYGTPEEDKLFAAPRARIEDFTFGRKTSEVFDDMLHRSVPFYAAIQRMIAELAADFAMAGTQLYDLGCSTWNSFVDIERRLPEKLDVKPTGIDSSKKMLKKARQKLVNEKFDRAYELQYSDLDRGVHIVNASVVIIVLTLQFTRSLYRTRLIESIRRSIIKDGCLLLVEKVLGENSTLNRLFITYYYDMERRNGYSDMEVAQKREALENMFIPYRLEENR